MLKILRSHTPFVCTILDDIFPLYCAYCECPLIQYQKLKKPSSNNPYEERVLVKQYLEQRLFCKICLKKIESYRIFQDKILCHHCGSPKVASRCPCEVKISADKNHPRLRSIFTYSDEIRKLIFLIKFNPSVDLCNWASLLLISNISALFQSEEGPNYTTWDSISFVPSKVESILKRGGYSTYLICRSLSKLLGDLPILDVSNHSELRQSSLKFNERIRRKSRFSYTFIAKKPNDKTNPKSTLLIDDMLTTGSSVHEVASLLANYDIKRVDILTLARATDFRRNYLRYLEER